MTLLLVPMLLALVGVLLVPRIKARQAASGGSERRRAKQEQQPRVHKFVL